MQIFSSYLKFERGCVQRDYLIAECKFQVNINSHNSIYS